MSADPQASLRSLEQEAVASAIAVITYREHPPPSYVLTGLVAEGLSVLERRLDPETEAALVELAPSLLVVCIDSGEPEEMHIIQRLSRELDAYIVAVANHASAKASAALDAGADACIEIGGGGDLLKSQIRAVLRRAAAAIRRPGSRIITVLDLEIDLGRRRVMAGKQVVPLTSTEYEILAQLALRPGEAIRSSEIAAAVWPSLTTEREARTLLKTHIRRIRRKLAETGKYRDYVWNLRGFGYLLDERPRQGSRTTLER